MMEEHDHVSYFSRGDRAFDEGRLLSAFRLFLLGAKAGDKDCQQKLGYIYDGGHSVKPNIKKQFIGIKNQTRKTSRSQQHIIWHLFTGTLAKKRWS